MYIVSMTFITNVSVSMCSKYRTYNVSIVYSLCVSIAHAI